MLVVPAGTGGDAIRYYKLQFVVRELDRRLLPPQGFTPYPGGGESATGPARLRVTLVASVSLVYAGGENRKRHILAALSHRRR